MTTNGATINLEEAQRFLASCKSYSAELDNALAELKNSLDHVGNSWRDDDYGAICAMVADVEREAAKALQVTEESIVPYVSKKIDLVASK